jgi:hypothetical protein
MSEENNCIIISSRGILKSCKIHSLYPISSISTLQYYPNNFISDYEYGDSIYICNSALPFFILYVFPIMKKPFVLVSGDSDDTIPDDTISKVGIEKYNYFLQSELLLHWYCQNWTDIHNKVTHMPIGLDYHTIYNNINHGWGDKLIPTEQEKELYNVFINSNKIDKRKFMCYSNCHFFVTTKYGYDRIDAKNKIDPSLVYYEPTPVKRLITWKNQSSYVFVISPHGNGLDCHRTWEALALGCIPIVKKSKLDNLFKNYPIWIVNDWSDVTNENMINAYNIIINNTYNKECMLLNYWIDNINSWKIKK